ncbi:hypothetical protein E1263_00365 [Kribbella antibiotica]|uniref:Uncharacterized protein n=1 Tax=Kribbella antibiotica TaxID=190195 RepID=A0A4R4ZXV3_9ACTN|nr:hypothetical protein [Kribbella antibiotica]TDD63440.1 hypothetical protein E1263_00365 [Kribbella antibiotica]
MATKNQLRRSGLEEHVPEHRTRVAMRPLTRVTGRKLDHLPGYPVPDLPISLANSYDLLIHLNQVSAVHLR